MPGKGGKILPIRSRRSKQKVRVETDVTTTPSTGKPIRGRRRLAPVFAPDDPLEPRAANVDGSILERVVYKELLAQVGINGFIYKKTELGGRLFRGGIEIDFVVINRHPNVAIEVLGAQWHGPELFWKDAARATIVRSLPGITDGMNLRYEEITEAEIRREAQYLEYRIQQLLGRGVDLGVSSL